MSTWTRITMATGLIAMVVGFFTWSDLVRADTQPDQPQSTQQGAPTGGFDFQMLINGLNATPGCHGVEVAQFQSGKLSIMAWFENKAAAMRWYNHPIHRGAMRGFFPHGSGASADYQPLAHIAEDDAPLMVIATITPSQQTATGGPPLSQISIELYQPLPGGMAVGGRLAPQAVDVPHMNQVEHFPGPPAPRQ